jgi:OOP family OmpA-OmpF porin
MKKSLLMAVAGMLAAASIASAANREGQFSISPVIGGYTYDSPQGIGWDSNPVFGFRTGYNITKHIGVEALFDYVYSNRTSYPNHSAVNMYRYGGELLYNFFPDNNFVPYLAAGVGGVNFSGTPADKKAHTAFDAGVGAKYFLNDSFALRGDLRVIGYDRYSRFNGNLEYTLGAYIPFGGAKPVAKAVEPPPPAPKAIPAAPTALLTVTPDSVTKGQTAALNWKSQNATGCDIQPGIGPVPPQGARTIAPTDSTNYTLECTGAGGTATSTASVTVVVPPPAPAPVVQKPKPTPAAVKFCNKPAILEIHFDSDKSDIKPQYHAELKTVGDFLKEFPNSKGEISGHTDSTASVAHNQKLSERRAESVARYIEKNFGIAAGRITTKGYGESKPIASNKTKEGRAKNRRIEANFSCD